MIDNANRAKPVGRRVFREGIREQLIEDILSGRLPPGARIVETRLAQQLGVSQGPVREALRDLELFGFVVSSPFRGTQVRKISTEDLLEIYPVRAALEGVAARAAATRIDEATLAELEQLIDGMRDAASRKDQRAHVNADFSFHHAIVKASGNRITHRSLAEIGERHVPVLDALRTRDPVIAEAAMRRHIEEPGDWIRAAVQQERAAESVEGGEQEAAG
jgi:DNA-binding GntR family transcriptional regulator